MEGNASGKNKEVREFTPGTETIPGGGIGEVVEGEIRQFLLHKYGADKKELIDLAIVMEKENVVMEGMAYEKHELEKVEKNLTNHLMAVEGLHRGFSSHVEKDDQGKEIDVITNISRPLVVKGWGGHECLRIVPVRDGHSLKVIFDSEDDDE